MPKSKTALAGLVVICITVLVGLWACPRLTL